MEQYLSISPAVVDIPIIAFDKLDGNNIRCEWTRKGKTFEKFGSRKVLLVYKKGYMLPSEFVKMFYGGNTLVDAPDILYRGNPGNNFIESVRNKSLPGITSEGVVCKGAPTKRGYPSTMFKVKTSDWLEKVKARFGHDPKMLEYLL